MLLYGSVRDKSSILFLKKSESLFHKNPSKSEKKLCACLFLNLFMMRGFHKRNNTCYLNSLLQAFLMCSKLVNYYQQLETDDTLENQLKALSHKFFYRLSTLDIEHLKQYLFKRCKTDFSNALEYGQQQDCYEFYNYFCSLLSRTTRLLHENPFAELYSILLHQASRCLTCSNASTTITNTFSLEVTLKESDHVTTLSTLVANYLERELVERQCPHCCSNRASSTQTMASSPEYLVVCIKRFSWNFVTQTAKKVDRPVIVLPNIQLSRCYDLVHSHHSL